MRLDDGDSLARLADRRVLLARQWDDLVAQVRRLDAFADFLKPPSAASLLAAGREGPVVVVNVSRWRCDALIVAGGSVGNRRLEKLVERDVETYTDSYLQVLQQWERAADERRAARDAVLAEPSMANRQAEHGAKTTVRNARGAVEAMLSDLLAWLWDCLAEPVLDELGFTGAPAESGWPRLWWCPTGKLALLPLHAAGYHGKPPKAAPRTVIDRVVSSYAPTVQSLLDARTADRTPDPDDDGFLLVGLARTPGRRNLAGADSELQAIAAEQTGRSTVLLDGEATVEAVLTALPHHPRVHFSCHGDQNLVDPSRGGLELHDGSLTVADIGSRRFRGEFAALGACKTATGGIGVPDEAVTLTGAFHFSGYRHVIGTLWSVYDTIGTPTLFRDLYRDLTSTGRFDAQRSAVALHRATRGLRDAHRQTPSVWTPFTHTGP